MGLYAYDPWRDGAFTVIDDFRIASVLTRLFCRFPANDDLFGVDAIRTFYPVVVGDDERQLSDLRFVFRSVRILFLRGFNVRDDFVDIIKRGIPTAGCGIIRVDWERCIFGGFFLIIFRTRYYRFYSEAC